MKVTKLISTCDIKDCPTIYATDRGTFLVRTAALEAEFGVARDTLRKAVKVPEYPHSCRRAVDRQGCTGP